MLRVSTFRKSSALASAALMLVATAAPAFMSTKASAYALLTTRSIQMESSADGTTTDGQGVKYDVTFTTATTGNIGSVAVEFCSNSPIIGDACTPPTGLDTNFATTTIVNQSGVTDWSATPHATESTANRIVLTRTAANVAASTVVSFDLGTGTGANGIDNPNGVNGSFYARIFTYVATDGTGTEVDAGGIALSTAAQINVTAKVQERLFFCVYTTGAGNDCTGKSGTAITLGDTNGVLSPTGPFVDKNAKFSITTNATGNAVVTVKGSTLASGGNTITAIGGTAATSTTAAEQYGFCLYDSAGSGGLTEDALYDGGAGAECAGTTQTAGTGSTGGNGTADFAFDTAATTSTFGDAIATKAAGDWTTATLAMIGNISNLTEAGIYTSTLTFIATGTY